MNLRPVVMAKIKALTHKMNEQFIDYCNVNNINLIQWYRWQLHLIWEQRNIGRKASGYFLKKRIKRNKHV